MPAEAVSRPLASPGTPRGAVKLERLMLLDPARDDGTVAATRAAVPAAAARGATVPWTPERAVAAAASPAHAVAQSPAATRWSLAGRLVVCTLREAHSASCMITCVTARRSLKVLMYGCPQDGDAPPRLGGPEGGLSRCREGGGGLL